MIPSFHARATVPAGSVAVRTRSVARRRSPSSCLAGIRPASGPPRSASSAASDDGAETAARMGMPAIDAFWVSSKLALPDTISTVPRSGSLSSRERPADDLVDRVVAPDVFPHARASRRGRPSKSAAACSPPVFSNTAWPARMLSGNLASEAGSTVSGSSATSYADCAAAPRRCSSLPHSPHELVMVSACCAPTGIGRASGGQRHVEHVVVVVGRPVAGAVARTDDIVAVTHDPLATRAVRARVRRRARGFAS